MNEKILHKAWLLDGLFHSAPGFIVIENSVFRFSLIDTGTFSKKRIQRWEQLSGQVNLFERLREEEVIEILNVGLDKLDAYFPWYNFMGGAKFRIDGQAQELHLSFMQPQNTKFPYHRLGGELTQIAAALESSRDLKNGREFGKRLKQLFQKQ